MSRLFITQREVNFVSDITKEYTKDIVGSAIYLYSVSEIKTKNHDLYNESPEKIFDKPIKIEGIAGQPQQTTTAGKIGYEQNWTLEVYIQNRDLIDKGINIMVGDFFTYGPTLYEITNVNFIRNLFGQVENVVGVTIKGQNVRESQFNLPKIFGPTSDSYSDADAVQTTFVQQRGFETNSEGATADVRDLQKNGVLDAPIADKPAEVSGKGDPEKKGSSFYGDES